MEIAIDLLKVLIDSLTHTFNKAIWECAFLFPDICLKEQKEYIFLSYLTFADRLQRM